MAIYTCVLAVNTPISVKVCDTQRIGDGPRMTIGDCALVESAPTGGATYPTIPVGSRLLVIQDGRYKAVTPG